MPSTGDLVAEAKRLAESLPSELNIEWADGNPVFSPELRDEVHVQWEAMAEIERRLAEFAGWDGAALRAAAGPPVRFGHRQPWQDLLIGAAITSEHRNLPVDEVALDLARMACFGAAIEPHGDWVPTHAKHAQDSVDPAASLRGAIEVLPLEARRPPVCSAAVVERAKARLERALEQIVSD